MWLPLALVASSTAALLRAATTVSRSARVRATSTTFCTERVPCRLTPDGTSLCATDEMMSARVAGGT
eukprot:8298-Heterococcus_DN1.PRE.2